MTNRRILYLSTHHHDDRSAFSGTNRRIFDALCEIDEFDVQYLQVKPNASLRLLHRTLGLIFRFIFHKDYQTGLGERYYASICRKALRYLKRNRFDGVVCWQICFGGVFSKFKGKKIFFADSTYHQMVPYYEWVVSEKQFRRNDASQKLLLTNADQFWCFSSFFVDDAKNYYGVPGQKIKMCRFFPTLVGDGTKRDFGDDKELHLLLVGTNFKDKGVPVAIQTVQILRNQYMIQASLDVVGVDAQGETELSYVRFHGRVNQFEEPDKMSVFYQNADLFILPTHHECAGIVFTEAASFGVPSIAYATGGVPDYVKNGESGYLLPEGSPASAFAELIYKHVCSRADDKVSSKTAYAFYQHYLSKAVFLKEASLRLQELFDNI